MATNGYRQELPRPTAALITRRLVRDHFPLGLSCWGTQSTRVRRFIIARRTLSAPLLVSAVLTLAQPGKTLAHRLTPVHFAEDYMDISMSHRMARSGFQSINAADSKAVHSVRMQAPPGQNSRFPMLLRRHRAPILRSRSMLTAKFIIPM